jgi:hypothetical protein
MDVYEVTVKTGLQLYVCWQSYSNRQQAAQRIQITAKMHAGQLQGVALTACM